MKTTLSLKRTVTTAVGSLMLVGLLTGGMSHLGDRMTLTRTAQAREEIQPDPAAPPRQFHCSNETLAGRYALVGDGFVRAGGPTAPPSAPLVPFAVVSLLTMDGAGGLSNQVTRSINGFISTSVGSGTYFVNADCTGKMTSGFLTFDLVMADLQGAAQGKEFYLIATTEGGVVSATAKRIQ